MNRCGCCKLTVVTDGHEMCPECESAIQDARMNPSEAHYPQTGVVISGYSMEEIESKKVALDIIGNQVTGRDEMSKAVFDVMCECVGVQFCYECGTNKEADAAKVTELARQFGLRPTASGGTEINPDVRYGGSYHAPISSPSYFASAVEA